MPLKITRFENAVLKEMPGTPIQNIPQKPKSYYVTEGLLWAAIGLIGVLTFIGAVRVVSSLVG